MTPGCDPINCKTAGHDVTEYRPEAVLGQLNDMLTRSVRPASPPAPFTLGTPQTVYCTYGTTPPCGKSTYATTDIVGSYFAFDGNVPIPAAAWLFGSGLAGLTGVARLRKS
jgi:hypothetical protein